MSLPAIITLFCSGCCHQYWRATTAIHLFLSVSTVQLALPALLAAIARAPVPDGLDMTLDHIVTVRYAYSTIYLVGSFLMTMPWFFPRLGVGKYGSQTGRFLGQHPSRAVYVSTYLYFGCKLCRSLWRRGAGQAQGLRWWAASAIYLRPLPVQVLRTFGGLP
jgi:hypothetical protein